MLNRAKNVFKLIKRLESVRYPKEEFVRVGTRLSERPHYDFGQCFIHKTFGYCGIILGPVSLRCNHTHLGHERAYQVLADFNHIRSLQPVAQFVPQFRQVNDSFELFSVHDICTVDQIVPMKPIDREPIYNPFQHHFIDAFGSPTALFKELNEKMKYDVIRSGGGYQGERGNQSMEAFFTLDSGDEIEDSIITEHNTDFKVTSRLVFLGSYDSPLSVDTDKTCVWHMSIMIERWDSSNELPITGTKLKVIDSKSREDHFDGFFNVSTGFDKGSSILYKTCLLQTTDKFNIKVNLEFGQEKDITVTTFTMPFISR